MRRETAYKLAGRHHDRPLPGADIHKHREIRFKSLPPGQVEHAWKALQLLKGLQIDGLVHVTSLGSDYFRFHERDRTLVGERTKLRIAIGDELRVQLTRVDTASRKIDFALTSRTAEHHHPRRAAKRANRSRKRADSDRHPY